MNKLFGILILAILMFSLESCEKKKIEVKSLDFSYADDISGTYVGTRRRDLGPYAPSEHQNIIFDTIVVEITDHRNSRTCEFRLDIWDEPIILRPDMTYTTTFQFKTEHGHHDWGELSIKDGVFRYAEYYRLWWKKYYDVPQWHKVLHLVLEKQE